MAKAGAMAFGAQLDIKVAMSLPVAAVLLVGVYGSAATNQSQRREFAIGGLFDYFWTYNSPAPAQNYSASGYFMSCGQIGGMGFNDSRISGSECVCESPTWCLNCYRWWDAQALEMIANNGIYTQSLQYSLIPLNIYSRSPYNHIYPYRKRHMWIDDFAWYGMAYLRVYEWLGDIMWLNEAEQIYNLNWEAGWDWTGCGGFSWTNTKTMQGKVSISNVEMLAFASKLALAVPGKQGAVYLSGAMRIWDWIMDVGLVDDQGLVAPGAGAVNSTQVGCCNGSSSLEVQTANGTIHYGKCSRQDGPGYSYNHGMFLASCGYLYAATGNVSFVTAGLKTLDAVISTLTTTNSSDGVLTERGNTIATPLANATCSNLTDPGGSAYSFKGIFMQQLTYFLHHINGTVGDRTSAVASQRLVGYVRWVRANSNAVWANAAFPPFASKSPVDVCNSRPAAMSINPKFQWDWSPAKQSFATAAVCLDARSQISAAQLFLADYALQNEQWS